MIRRIQFCALPHMKDIARSLFEDALERMLSDSGSDRVYVTIELEPQYRNLRSKLAKRATAKRAR